MLTLLEPAWPAPPGVAVVHTLTRGGGRFGSANLALHVGDDTASVTAMRTRLRVELGVSAVVYPEQVHGTDVVEVSVRDADVVHRADALWTRDQHVGCAILTADCLPVVLARRDGSMVGVAHCGWRGLAAGVLRALVAALPAHAAELVAHLGPGIGAARYQVGADVVDAFAAWGPGAVAQGVRFGTRDDQWRVDLEALARWQLRQLGVMDIHGGGYCTGRDPRFYSFRRDGQTGRFATIVWRR